MYLLIILLSDNLCLSPSLCPALIRYWVNSHNHTLTRNTFGHSKSPCQYSPRHIPHHQSPETRTSSTCLKPPQHAPRKGPSAKAGSAHGGRDPTSRGPSWVIIPRPVDHLINAPRLGQRLSLLTQGLRVQAGVVITLSADHLLHDTPQLSQQPFSLTQDLHIRVHPVDHLLDIPHRGHQIGELLDSITHSLIPLFQAVLTRAAKLEMRLQAVLTHPVPKHQDVLQLAREVLDAVLWSYHSKKIKMENGYFLQYRAQMSCLLCDDLFTFHTELKKVVISIAKQLYGIFPKANMGQKDAVQWHVVEAALKLIKSGDYLQLPDSSSGKYKNFVLQVLKDACIDFYYGNGKKALKLTKEFHKTIPINALILVSAVAKGILTVFYDTGTDKVPNLSTDKCRSDFNSLRRSVDTLMDNSECRQELESMLEEWADVGMMGPCHTGKEEPDKGSYMNCSALMNLMEVKMDQIQDGTLLDASQIQWYNDPDDDTPLPVLPAQACRSTRIPHPAPKLVDPNNAVLRKRKASRSVVTSEGSEEESDCEGDQDNGVTTDAATDMDHETDIDGITPSESASQ
ncbi:uncharacterized protein EDB93DRAFT_1246123 [Suillus bovinus]|uniref:uncharacterized protein n=1 Tax=Suillus bovinus TaxID=48563 RepID=UPI001B8632DA|nr:uncharacterized protein EDB93DRAFT_1246123 [Suillus bovinus]KAG2158269.1 hypothetical protein EDB93DRAFT_1246123 [Suillus bovinus]